MAIDPEEWGKYKECVNALEESMKEVRGDLKKAISTVSSIKMWILVIGPIITGVIVAFVLLGAKAIGGSGP